MLPLAAAAGGDTSSSEWVLVAILAGVAVLFVLSYVTRVPYPIWLTLGGVAMGFFPGLPDVRLDPDLVLVIVLPPLLYSAAFFSDLRELRRNARPIGLLAVVLVLLTTVAVAAVAHALIPGLSWEAAFLLGAVLGPTDPVAATAIAGRVGAPRQIVTVLEGESLVNDSTALIAFKYALGAAMTGTFSLVDAAGDFVLSVGGGALIGLAVSWAVVQVRLRIHDRATESVLSLMTAYFAYLPADAVGASGVIAAVTAGIVLGLNAPRLITAETRIQLYGLWDILVFLLNGLLFVLVGLQLPEIVERLGEQSAGELTLYAVAIALTVMAARAVWIFAFGYVTGLLARRREREPPSWRNTTIVAFTCMRGAVSLAAAIAIPTSVPGRDLIVFLVFTTIVWTVCLEGLSLPSLLRVLGVHDDGATEREENKARVRAADAALRRVDELVDEPWVRDDTAERVRGTYDFRRRRFAQRLGDTDQSTPEEDIDGRSSDYQRLLRELLQAQRDELLALRRAGVIGDDVMRRVERELDLEESRLR